MRVLLLLEASRWERLLSVDASTLEVQQLRLDCIHMETAQFLAFNAFREHLEVYLASCNSMMQACIETGKIR